MKKRFWQRLLISSFCLLLAAGGLSLTLFPAARYSATENRHLTAFPRPTRESVLDGSFMRTLDTYATERAPFRGACRGVWSTAQLLAGQHESHGVILCRDGSLSARITTNADVLSRNLAALAHVRHLLCDMPLITALAPARIEARQEVLPVTFSACELSAPLATQFLTFPECTADAAWFRTDHHWTAAGAYLAYVRLSAVLGYEPLAANTFTPQTVSESFLGSSASRAGLPHVTPDSITLWRYEGDDTLRITRDGVPATFEGLYDWSKLATRDGYSVFLGGNCGVLNIDRGEGDTRPTLLVIRDSFASALLPFLARHYRIVALDPRYAAPSLRALGAKADAALLLCGVQTISTEPFLTSLLRQ